MQDNTVVTHTIYLSLGSNLGDRQENLIAALQDLKRAIEITKISSVYETEPVDYLNQPPFFNLICVGITTLSAQELLKLAKETEVLIGRQPSVRYGPRLIDIDIIFYDDLHIIQDDLIVPHPRMAQRAFVLVPLVEIAPNIIDPISGHTTQELLRLISQDGVKRIEADLSGILGELQ